MSNVDFKQVLHDSGVPVEKEALTEKLREVAAAEGAPFNNQSEYSPFWRLVKALMVTPLMWLIELLHLEILPALFLKTTTGQWVDVFADQLGLVRKPATKARGMITLTRYEGTSSLVVPVGTVIQSAPINHQVYRMVVVNEAEFQPGITELEVLCEAAEAGSAYNLADGFYAVLSTPLAGVIQVGNKSDWLLVPGADRETDDELKARCRNQFSAVNQWHIDAVYKAMVSRWPGISIDDIYIVHDAPRGPGTANIYVLFEHDAPASEYLEAIQQYIMTEGNHGLGDDLLLAEMPTQTLDVSAVIVVKAYLDAEAKEALRQSVSDFIAVALRDLPNADYQPTRVQPYQRFVWSRLIQEMHNAFPDLVSVDFANDADIEPELWIPELNNLEVVAV